ncbi:tetratricopeptide repeat protein [archaeon]|jgi:tetratricopeptide (TPR) repeat protein|nr:tetratricopeptide repeat protein [Candidatus Woesearchaeota archaeon]MBT3464061.1 tetratricopeptide repeat protein [archaeon]MBT4351493.1 tetratricopeptide repeat protein [archaeon]MBT4647537.1 tetratricopeptide repeat protein [archaeon]MBT6821966.1 tetratricopeptide repeat protein [archaeon]
MKNTKKKKNDEKVLLGIFIIFSIILTIVIINNLLIQNKYINEKNISENNKNDTNSFKLERAITKIDKFTKAIKKDPNNENNYVDLGWIYYEMGNFEIAKDLFLKTIEINPENVDGILGIARYYSNIGKFNTSKIYFDKLQNKSINDSLYYHEFGIFLRTQSMFKKAEKLLIEGLKLYPEDDFMIYELGLVYYSLNKTDLAEKQFLKSIEINNASYSCPYNALGLIYYKRQDNTKAIENLHKTIKKGIELFGESHFDNLVYQHLEEGNLELAIDLVKRLETNPFDKKVISLYLKDGENQQTELKVNETIELLNSMK